MTNSNIVSLVKRPDDNNSGVNGLKGPSTIMLANGTKLHFQQNVISIPELILPSAATSTASEVNGTTTYHAIPIEVITSVANGNGLHHNVVENEEVMWGAGTSLGPAVVVEAADTVPVTYIEASEIVYSAASLDNIDYDYLYPVTTTSSGNSVVHCTEVNTTSASENSRSSVRERQLEFNML